MLTYFIRVCAWCGDELGRILHNELETVTSHGMCQHCLDRVMLNRDQLSWFEPDLGEPIG